MSVKCIECQNAKFQTTPSGRIKKAFGKCGAIIELPKIACVSVSFRKSAIWPDSTYEICESFQPDTTESGK